MPQPEWYQQALTPPDVLQANVRIGVIPSRDHVQVLAELIDPVSGIQIAQWSSPHRRVIDLHEAVAEAYGKVVAWLDEAIDPF